MKIDYLESVRIQFEYYNCRLKMPFNKNVDLSYSREIKNTPATNKKINDNNFFSFYF